MKRNRALPVRRPLLALSLIAAGHHAAAQAPCDPVLIPSVDGVPNDFFGTALGAGADRFAVAASNDTGAIGSEFFVFDRTPSGWMSSARLELSGQQGIFSVGDPIAIDGDRIAIVSGGERDVHVFDFDGVLWRETAVLDPGGVLPLSPFERSVGLSGDSICVSTSNGLVFFERGPTGWVRDDSVTTGQPAGDCDLEGDRALAIVANFFTGTKLVSYERVAGAWTQTAVTTLITPTGWGSQVEIAGDRAVFTAPSPEPDPPYYGAPSLVHFLEYTSPGWVLDETFTLDGISDTAVAMSDRFAVVGFLNEQAGGNALALFEHTPAGWVNLGGPDDSLAVCPSFGRQAHFAGEELLVGDPASRAPVINSGAVFSYTFGGGERYCSAVPSSEGAVARVRACGDFVAGFELSAEPVPPQPGLFFYGAGQTSVPFGDGNLCVTGMLFRLPPENAVEGRLRSVVDFSDPPIASGQITAGSTWNFQAWFRDPDAAGAGFNLSDALRVTF